MKLLINIDVDDLEKGVAFYQGAFGLRLRRRLFDGTVAEMTGAFVERVPLEQTIGELRLA